MSEKVICELKNTCINKQCIHYEPHVLCDDCNLLRCSRHTDTNVKCIPYIEFELPDELFKI